MSAAALEVSKVWKYYGDFPALRDIQLSIEPGSTVALLGRNGAGKTTLLRIIAGLSKASEGSVSIQGSSVREQSTRRRIGVLGHGISLYDELSAAENLILFAKLYGLDDPEKKALAWLERTGLDRVRDGLVREFSRGMRQRLAVARAFMHEPEVLLLDEPFTSLDDRAIAVLQSLLADAHSSGRTIVLSTHQLREALELATHVALIQRGQLAFHRRAHPTNGRRHRLALPHPRRELTRVLLPARLLDHRRQRSALRNAHERSVQCILRVLASNPGALQLRLRPLVRRAAHDFRRPPVAGLLLRRSPGAKPAVSPANSKTIA